MVVRVAERARDERRGDAWSSPPTTSAYAPPSRARHRRGDDARRSSDRHRSPRRGGGAARPRRRRDRRQRAGRRAAARAGADPRGAPTLLDRARRRGDRDRVPPDRRRRRGVQSERGQGGARRAPATRCISAARRFPGRATRSPPIGDALPAGLPLYRHYGLYAYRVAFPAALSDAARRRRSSASRRSSSCARCGTATGSSSSITRRHAGAGRRHAGRSRRACARCTRQARFDRARRFRPESRRAAQARRLAGTTRRRPTITIHDHATDTARPARRRQGHAGHLHQARPTAFRRSRPATCCAPRSRRARRSASRRRR